VVGITCCRTSEFVGSLSTYLVSRLVKYTGYGNAAGLLHDLSLIGTQHNAKAEQYSSDSDESDTEIYKKIRDEYE
jgi:hypothetical protein